MTLLTGVAVTPDNRAAGIRRSYEKATNPELPLDSLRELEEIVEHLSEWRRALIRIARQKGASFTQIAHVYGISRQAARERFKDLDDAEDD